MLKSNHEKTMEVISHSALNVQGYYNVPNRRARHFKGRQAILTTLQEDITEERILSRCIVLRGLGGQGKSQIAIEYCQQTRKYPFTTTFWIDATSANTIKRGMELFYERFRSQSDDRLETIEAIVDFARDIFERIAEPWLMVFDNYDDPTAGGDLRSYMPSSRLGTILVTSRHAEVLNLATPGWGIEVGPLTSTEASELLCVSANVQPNARQQEAAQGIVARLSCHALAIAQAGAYLRKKRLPLEDFLSNYSRLESTVLNQSSTDLRFSEYQRKTGTSDLTIPLSVFATWELSFQQLKMEKGSKMYKEDLLTIFAFSYGHHTSEEMLKTFCSNMEPWDTPSAMSQAPGSFLADRLGRWNTEIFAEIVAEFEELCLIQGVERTESEFSIVSIHPLVKDWIKLRTLIESCWEYQLVATEIMVEATNPSKVQDSQTALDPISPELLSTLNAQYFDDQLQSRETPTPVTAGPSLTQLLNTEESLAALLSERGNYKETENLTNRVFQICAKNYGRDNRKTIQAAIEYAIALARMGKETKAEDLLRSMLDSTTRIDGQDGPMTNDVLSLLAQSLSQNKKFHEAMVIHKAVLLRSERLHGEGHKYNAHPMLQLSRALVGLQQYDDAANLLLKVQDLDGLDWEVQFVLEASLANLQRNLGNYEAAEQSCSRAFQLRLEHLGPDHPQTIYALGSLAETKYCLWQMAECETIYRRVIDKLLPMIGSDNSYMLNYTLYLASSLMHQKKHEEALVQTGRGCEICLAIGDCKMQQIIAFLSAMESWALALRDGVELVFAERMTKQLLEARGKLLGPLDPATLLTQEILSSIQTLKAEGSIGNK